MIDLQPYRDATGGSVAMENRRECMGEPRLVARVVCDGVQIQTKFTETCSPSTVVEELDRAEIWFWRKQWRMA